MYDSRVTRYMDRDRQEVEEREEGDKERQRLAGKGKINGHAKGTREQIIGGRAARS